MITVPNSLSVTDMQSSDLPKTWTPEECRYYAAARDWWNNGHIGIYRRHCVVCQHEFFRQRPTAKYCCASCAKVAANERQRQQRAKLRNRCINGESRTCQECGWPIPRDVRTDARFCRVACKQRNYRQRPLQQEPTGDARLEGLIRLLTDPAYYQQSDRWFAELCRVSLRTVSKYRRQVRPESAEMTVKCQDGRRYRVRSRTKDV